MKVHNWIFYVLSNWYQFFIYDFTYPLSRKCTDISTIGPKTSKRFLKSALVVFSEIFPTNTTLLSSTCLLFSWSLCLSSCSRLCLSLVKRRLEPLEFSSFPYLLFLLLLPFLLGEIDRWLNDLFLDDPWLFLFDELLSGEDLLAYLLLLRQERLLLLFFASFIGDGVEEDESGEEHLELK